jgi:hypothetical protein
MLMHYFDIEVYIVSRKSPTTKQSVTDATNEHVKNYHTQKQETYSSNKTVKLTQHVHGCCMGLAYETLAAIAPALTQLSRPPCTSEYT